jgi:hypothetical protein
MVMSTAMAYSCGEVDLWGRGFCSVAQSGAGHAPSAVYSRVAAAVLTERFDEILEDYERRLLGMDSFVIVGEGSGTGAREAQARSMASRAAAILRGEDASALEMEEEIYRNIEASREPLNPHPDEAFRAGEAFCGAALSAIARHLPPRPRQKRSSASRSPWRRWSRSGSRASSWPPTSTT